MINVNSIAEAVKYHAGTKPGRLALCDKKDQVTYDELWRRAKKGAELLREAGVSKGDMVVIRAAQKISFVMAVLSVHLAGGAVCPLEKAVKEDRIREIAELVDGRFYMAESAACEDMLKNISLKEFFRAVSAESEEAVPEEPELPAPEGLSEILFTTGTTGKSKGIEVTFACDIAIAQNVMDSVDMGPDETELITSPINHSLAIRRTYAALYNGSTAVITEGFKFANSFYGLMDKYAVTGITFVPAILEQVLLFDREKLASYREQLHYIQLGSAPLSEENKRILTEMFPGVRLYNTYGATESGCTVILEFSRYPDKTKCIGRTTVNTELLFVNDDRKPVEASENEPANLAFKGPMNMRGYYGEPELTKEVLDDEGIIYTNDVGWRGEDGLVYLMGRKGDVINMGGIKIAPTEVEEAAMKHPMVRDCACIPVPDPLTGEAPLLCVAVNEGAEYDSAELYTFLKEKLESVKVPKRYLEVETIPRTFNGKIIRREVKEMAASYMKQEEA
ncbi:MAG: acyl--CoA ligase [Lachnospiraceae bacterium]|nr:acyl--CoA ligase [Lachnospiraceae bacterium]